MPHELGEGAKPSEFAMKYITLSGDKLMDTVPQNSACLELSGQYAGDIKEREWQ